MHAYSQLMLGWVVVSAQYQHNAGAALDKPTLFSALEQVVYAHPALTVRLATCTASQQPQSPAQNPAVWKRLPSIDLNRIVEFHDSDAQQLERLLEDILSAPIEHADDVPLWKLWVLRDGTVVFAYEHTIGDGQSGVAFHIALLSALRRLQVPVSEHPGILADYPEDAALAPPLEKCMKLSLSFNGVIREVVKSRLPGSLRKDSKAWTGERIPKRVDFRTTVRILQYSSEEAQRLVRLSRAHNTTLTGTLHTLILVILSRLIYGLPDAERYTSVASFVPISVRRFAGTPSTAICNHASGFSAYHPLFPQGGTNSDEAISTTTFPWDRAASVSATLKREAPRSGQFAALLRLLFGKYDKHIRSQLGKKRGVGFELSNLGPFPVDIVSGQGPWTASRVIFVQSDATAGGAIVVNAAGAPDGGLGLTVTWGKASVQDALAQKFFDGFKDGVKALLAAAES
ncbi:alcohol acetyltransferase [Trametes meyenii]|nr:alcohol acetyltransferase [Trametes meyenii]